MFLAPSKIARDAVIMGDRSCSRSSVDVYAAVDTFTIADWYDRFVALTRSRAQVSEPR